MNLDKYKSELQAIIDARSKATQGEWRWQDRYDFREHIEHQKQGLDADCPNIRDGRITLEPKVLRDWASYADDSGLEISKEDAELIALAANTIDKLAKNNLMLVEALEKLESISKGVQHKIIVETIAQITGSK